MDQVAVTTENSVRLKNKFVQIHEHWENLNIKYIVIKPSKVLKFGVWILVMQLFLLNSDGYETQAR